MPYLCDMFFIFISIFIMINRIISWKQTHLFICLFFKTCSIIFTWQRGWRMRIIFKEQKFSLRVLLSICLIFCQFQPGVSSKSVAYEKACHCVKSVRIRSYSGPHFSSNFPAFGLNTERYCIPRIRTLFTQCVIQIFSFTKFYIKFFSVFLLIF